MKSKAGYRWFLALFLTLTAVWAGTLSLFYPKVSLPETSQGALPEGGSGLSPDTSSVLTQGTAFDHSDGKSREEKGKRPSLFPPCPFHRVTGIYCPGCGSTRAAAALFQGDFRASLRNHPLLLPLLPVVVFLLVRFFYEGMTGREIRIPRWKEISLGGGILIVLFWLLRNIPLACFDLLRPPM